jgi:two-component system, sensor histidine kinase
MLLSLATGLPKSVPTAPRKEGPPSGALVAPDTRLENALVTSTSRRILVIEDNADSRETLCMIIELWGYYPEAARDGEEGIRMAIEGRPDTAVVDIGLPKVNGYEVARRLRAVLGDRIYLIALTAYARPEDRRRAYEAGFDFFMSKPANFEVLERLLSR